METKIRMNRIGRAARCPAAIAIVVLSCLALASSTHAQALPPAPPALPDAGNVDEAVPKTEAKSSVDADAKLEGKAEQDASKLQEGANVDAKAGADAKAQAETNAGADAKADVDADVDAKTGVDAKGQLDAKADTKTDAQINADSGAKSNGDAGAKADADLKTQPDVKAEVEGRGNAGLDASSQIDAESQSGLRANIRGQSQLDVDASTDPQLDVDARQQTDIGLNFPAEDNRLMISDVADGSIAARAGLQSNDEIVAINGRRISTDADLQTQLRTINQRDGFATIYYWRDGQLAQTRLDLTAASPSDARVQQESFFRGPEGAPAPPPAPGYDDSVPAPPGSPAVYSGYQETYYYASPRRMYRRSCLRR